MSTPADARLCRGCGERIGAYEPLVWRRPDGSLLTGGLLAFGEQLGDPGEDDLFHLDCFRHHGFEPDPGSSGSP